MSDKERRVFLIFDNQEERHDQPWPSYHIEVPKRLDAIYERLKVTGLASDPRIKYLPRREATRDELLAVHTERYIDDVQSTESMTVEQQEQFCTKYEDIYVNSATWKRAKLSAGSAIDLMVSVANSKLPGIAFIRPPGHHAMPDEGCGFCIFNNVAIAAKAAIQGGSAKKVLIVDYDVHAGNGTQECVEAMGDNVLLISIHRYENGRFWPNMPQTGIYHRYKNTVNLPLNTISHTDSDYHALFSHIILPFIHCFDPDLILISSGFDASLGDPEGYMNVTPAGFATMVRMLMDTGIPVAAFLEGGYFLDALAADSEWVLRSMFGERIPRITVEKLNPSVAETISRVMEKYESHSVFFRKVQDLRKILGQSIEKYSGETSDYEGRRSVGVPYDTRGIYTPFTDEKVEEFKNELQAILNSYKSPDNSTKFNVQDFLLDDTDIDVNENYLGTHNGKVVIGKGKAVQRFFELLFLAPLDSLITGKSYCHVKEDDFNDIFLDSSLRELKNIPIFQDLPLMQL